MKKCHLLYSLSIFALSACTSPPPPQISAAEAQARLNQIEQLDEREYQKYTQRDKEQYEIYNARRTDALKAQKIALQNEAIQYQNSRRETLDAIDDIGRMQMNKARAINKANENSSKKQDVYIIR